MIQKKLEFHSKYKELFDYIDSLTTLIKLSSQNWRCYINGEKDCFSISLSDRHRVGKIIHIESSHENSRLLLVIPIENQINLHQWLFISELCTENRILEFTLIVKHLNDSKNTVVNELDFKLNVNNEVKCIIKLINCFSEQFLG